MKIAKTMKHTNLKKYFYFFFCCLLSGISLPPMIQAKTQNVEFFPHQEKVLSNGLRLLVVPNKELPRIQLNFVLNKGSVWDPPQQAGLGYITAIMLKQGTRYRNSVQLSEDFAQIGSSLGVEVTMDSISFSASTLSSHGKRLLELLGQVLLSPRMLTPSLGKKDFLREKAKILQELNTLPDNGYSFTFHLFKQELFQSSLYGQPARGWRSTVEKIQHKDILHHYSQYYLPHHFTLVASGDIEEDLLKAMEDTFKNWNPAKAKTSPPLPLKLESIPAPQKPGRHLKLIDKKGFSSASYIMIGSQAVPRRDERYLALRTMHTALGDGLFSPLMLELRQKSSLVYSVQASMSSWKEAGAFYLLGATDSHKTDQVLKKMLSVFSKKYKKGLTSKDLTRAKNKIKHYFAGIVETSEIMADNLISLQNRGVTNPYQELQSYLERLENLSSPTIKQITQEVINLNNLQILIVGDKDKMNLQKIKQMKWSSFEVLPLEKASF